MSEQMPVELPPIPPPSELDIQSGAVYAKVTLQCGFRFGPYSMKWTSEPTYRNISWEVSNCFDSIWHAQNSWF